MLMIDVCGECKKTTNDNCTANAVRGLEMAGIYKQFGRFAFRWVKNVWARARVPAFAHLDHISIECFVKAGPHCVSLYNYTLQRARIEKGVGEVELLDLLPTLL